MTHHDNPETRNDPVQRFTLYLQENRLFARNADATLVELGSVGTEGGALRYALDGERITGQGLADADALLADLERKIDFLFLDGQFTALPDVTESTDLDGATSRDITLEEFGADQDSDPLARRVLSGAPDAAQTNIPAGPVSGHQTLR